MNIDQLLEQARQKLEDDDAAGALDDLNNILDQQSDHVDALLERAFAYYDLEEFEKALADIDQVLSLDADNAQAHNLRGNVLCDQDRQEEALAAYNQALELDPEHVSALTNRAELLMEQQNLDAALQDCNRLVGLDPEDADLWAMRARLRLAMQNFQGALDDLNEAFVRGHDDPGDLALRQEIREVLKAQEEPIPTSESEMPQEVSAMMELFSQQEAVDEKTISQLEQAWDLIKKLKGEEALAILNPLIQQKPLASAYRLRALAHQGMEQHEKARADIEAAIELAPENAFSYLVRSTSRVAMDDFDGALEDTKKAMELNPSLPEAPERMAILLISKGRFQEAEPHADKAVELDPQRSSAFVYRAMVLLNLAELDDALADCNQALRLAPHDSTALVLRGQIFQLQGNALAARDDLEEAAKTDSGIADALDNPDAWLKDAVDPGASAHFGPGVSGAPPEAEEQAPLTIQTLLTAVPWVVLAALLASLAGWTWTTSSPAMVLGGLTIILVCTSLMLPGPQDGRTFALPALILAGLSLYLIFHESKVLAEPFSNRESTVAWLMSWGLGLGLVIAFGLGINFTLLIMQIRTSILTAGLFLRQGYLPGVMLALIMWLFYSLTAYVAWPLTGGIAGAFLGMLATSALPRHDQPRSLVGAGFMLGVALGILVVVFEWLPLSAGNGAMVGLLLGVAFAGMRLTSNIAMLAQSKATLPRPLLIFALLGMLVGGVIGGFSLDALFIALRNALWGGFYWAIVGMLVGVLTGRILSTMQSHRVVCSPLWQVFRGESNEVLTPDENRMLVSGLCSFLGIYVGASVGFYGGLVTNILTPMDEVWAWLLSGGVIGAVSVALYFGQRLISVPGLGALGTLPMPIPPNEMAPRVLVGAIFGATVAGLAWLVSDEARPTHWLVLGGGIGAFLGARLWALLAREPRV